MIATVRPAVIRDASWITANLRLMDRAEAFCQLPPNTPSIVLAYWMVQSGEAFVAYLDDEPVCLFGTSVAQAVSCNVWAIGTERMTRAIPAVTRKLMTDIVERRIAQGTRIMEARSLVSHTTAHAWMRSTGAEQVGDAFEYGRDGELFLLFRWTVARYRAIREQRWSS